MLNLSFIHKKFFLRILDNLNLFISSKLSSLSFSNIKKNIKILILDKRTIITIVIIIFSIFAHLSTPAFYKDRWVKDKIRKHFEKEFSLKIKFNKKFYYSIFPVPNFVFKDVVIFDEEKNDLIQIEKLTAKLSYKKFFDKDKMNIQSVKIDDAKFNSEKKNLDSLLNYFTTKIPEQIISISDSKIFIQNKDKDVISIITITNGKTFFDPEQKKNNLNLEGKIFNTDYSFNLKNDINKKNLNFNLILSDLNINLSNRLNYLEKKKIGKLDYFFQSKNFLTNYTIEDKKINFSSKSKIENNKYLYRGSIELNPFISFLEINLSKVDLLKLVDTDSVLLKILRSNLFLNENFYFNFFLNSQKTSLHRKINDIRLKINFEKKKINFDNSSFVFQDIFEAKLINSEFVNKLDEQFFVGEISLDIKNSLNLYKFFQTNKRLRKEINKINIKLKYDFLNELILIEKISIDAISNENTKILINQFNNEKKEKIKRIDLNNFINQLFEIYNG